MHMINQIMNGLFFNMSTHFHFQNSNETQKSKQEVLLV